MKHARSDYDLIQDPRQNGIPEDEPVFLLRAQDICSPDIVMDWAQKAEDMGASSEIVKLARDQAVAMLNWGEKHKRQIPDLP